MDGAGQHVSSKSGVALESSISCTAAYRFSVSDAEFMEQSGVLSEERAEIRIAFTDIVFTATFPDEEYDWDNESFLLVRISRTDTEQEITRTLYQMGTMPPYNQFSGGHGFTGLHYVYHPVSRSELQYFCRTVP